MTAAKFTPGPWTQDKWGRVRGPDGETIRCTGVALANPSDDETRANDRLIASAPELLAALQGAVALADANKLQAEAGGRLVIRPPAMQGMYDKCVAAIAKATGGAQ